MAHGAYPKKSYKRKYLLIRSGILTMQPLGARCWRSDLKARKTQMQVVTINIPNKAKRLHKTNIRMRGTLSSRDRKLVVSRQSRGRAGPKNKRVWQ